MLLESEVEVDLNLEGDKKRLMQKYIERQQTILKKYGGNFNDLPINDDEYFKLQTKIQILHGMK